MFRSYPHCFWGYGRTVHHGWSPWRRKLLISWQSGSREKGRGKARIPHLFHELILYYWKFFTYITTHKVSTISPILLQSGDQGLKTWVFRVLIQTAVPLLILFSLSRTPSLFHQLTIPSSVSQMPALLGTLPDPPFFLSVLASISNAKKSQLLPSYVVP